MTVPLLAKNSKRINLRLKMKSTQKTRINCSKLTGLTEPLFVQIIIAMIVAIVWFALDPLHDGSLKIGDLVAFIEYSFHALLSSSLFS